MQIVDTLLRFARPLRTAIRNIDVRLEMGVRDGMACDAVANSDVLSGALNGDWCTRCFFYSYSSVRGDAIDLNRILFVIMRCDVDLILLRRAVSFSPKKCLPLPDRFLTRPK